MVYGLYSVRDLKVGFGAPMIGNETEIIRLFEHEVMQTSSLWNSHAADFMLFQIGNFDIESGHVDAFDNPEYIDSATSVLSRFKGEKNEI